jgi:hypothetical protein
MDKVILILILLEPPFLASFCPICPLRLDAKVSDLYGFPPPETWPSGGLLNRCTLRSGKNSHLYRLYVAKNWRFGIRAQRDPSDPPSRCVVRSVRSPTILGGRSKVVFYVLGGRASIQASKS